MRIEKTEKYWQSDREIMQAFAELLAEKDDVSEISVTDLAARAGMSRGTFYTHFPNVRAVAIRLEDEALQSLGTDAAKIRDLADLQRYFAKVFEFLAKNEKLYRSLFKSDAAVLLINRLDMELQEKILEGLHARGIRRRNLELDVIYNCDAAVQMMIHYFRGELKVSLEDLKWYLSEQFIRLMMER